MTDSLMIGFSRSVTLTGIRSPKLHQYQIWTPGHSKPLIGQLALFRASDWLMTPADNLPGYHHIRIHRYQHYYEDMIRIWDTDGLLLAIRCLPWLLNGSLWWSPPGQSGPGYSCRGLTRNYHLMSSQHWPGPRVTNATFRALMRPDDLVTSYSYSLLC